MVSGREFLGFNVPKSTKIRHLNILEIIFLTLILILTLVIHRMNYFYALIPMRSNYKIMMELVITINLLSNLQIRPNVDSKIVITQ